MKDLRKDEEFHETLGRLVENLHQQLLDKGYDLKVSQLKFYPNTGGQICPCGTESYQDPSSGEWKTRCRRCPPGGAVKFTKLLKMKNPKLNKKKGG